MRVDQKNLNSLQKKRNFGKEPYQCTRAFFQAQLKTSTVYSRLRRQAYSEIKKQVTHMPKLASGEQVFDISDGVPTLSTHVDHLCCTYYKNTEHI